MVVAAFLLVNVSFVNAKWRASFPKWNNIIYYGRNYTGAIPLVQVHELPTLILLEQLSSSPV
jgi:hypothetical protein